MPTSYVPIEQVDHEPADPTRANCPTFCSVETVSESIFVVIGLISPQC